MQLGVNVDHVATLRQARFTAYPDPVVGALLSEYAGASSIVAHLREDRRHINERDVFLIKEAIKIPLNLEMSANKKIVDIAVELSPHQATLVPEKRQELTTEGGLDLIKQAAKIKRAVDRLNKASVKVSLFIDPVKKQIKAAKDMGIEIVEFNTGRFSEAKTAAKEKKELDKIIKAVNYAKELGFFIAAGHGIDYKNVKKIAKVKQIQELNIGHSIISRAVFVGIVSAVEEMLDLMRS